MRAGALRHRVQIQSVSEARDAAGGVVQTWSTDATRWAAIEPLSDSEVLEAQRSDTKLTHKITMRHIPTITSNHRLLFGSRTFQIFGSPMNPDERGIETTFRVREVT